MFKHCCSIEMLSEWFNAVIHEYGPFLSETTFCLEFPNFPKLPYL